jgi:hypothetical protein
MSGCASRPGAWIDRRRRIAVGAAATMKRLGRVAVAAMALATGGPAMAQGVAPTGWLYGDPAVLQGLDKVTARISTFAAPIDRPVRFGTLEITLRGCYKRPPEEPPESAAFLEIHEIRPDEPPAELFVGWMFASSPALSALEHAVYDVWVIDCTMPRPPAEDG